MTWYVASVIMSIKFKEHPQSEIPVYENFVLIEGKTPKEALEKAIIIGKDEERYNDDMILDEKPSKMIFEGIRKLINISNPTHLDLDEDRPDTGTELTYSQYLLPDEEHIKKLVNGSELLIKYIE